MTFRKCTDEFNLERVKAIIPLYLTVFIPLIMGTAKGPLPGPFSAK